MFSFGKKWQRNLGENYEIRAPNVILEKNETLKYYYSLIILWDSIQIWICNLFVEVSKQHYALIIAVVVNVVLGI